MPTDDVPRSDDELMALDAMLAGHQQDWWNHFYEDRAKPCPFFVAAPDQSLVRWVREAGLHRGRALDLGCGNARNAIFLARNGFAVDAVDFSQTAIDWAAQRVAEAGVSVTLLNESVHHLAVTPQSYCLVYDSGCFHHIAPHRRDAYVGKVRSALALGGWFGMACCRPEGGSGLSDNEVYEHRSLRGGLGYTEARLREIWSNGFAVREVRQMDKQSPESGLFGEPFLWSFWAQRA
jgi:cyclopropane fatty-acyl-phospholipid synthase-like methyltransferase